MFPARQISVDPRNDGLVRQATLAFARSSVVALVSLGVLGCGSDSETSTQARPKVPMKVREVEVGDGVVSYSGWEGLVEQPVRVRCRYAALLGSDRIVAQDYPGSNERTLTVYSREHKRVVAEFSWGPEWYFGRFARSRQGDYVVVALADEYTVSGRYSPKTLCRIGVIGNENEINWVAELRIGSGSTPNGMAISDDGKSVALVGCRASNEIEVLDVERRALSWALKPERESGLYDVTFSPDGRTIYAVGTSGHVYGYDASSGELRTKWLAGRGETPTYGYRATVVDVSPDGTLLAVGTGPVGDVYVWDIKTESRLFRLNTGDQTVTVLAFSPDSRSLALSGTSSEGIQIWRVRAE